MPLKRIRKNLGNESLLLNSGNAGYSVSTVVLSKKTYVEINEVKDSASKT